VSTSITAIISKEWKQRMLIITLALAGMGCWFLYDGLVAWPKNNVKAAVYFELRDQYGKGTPELEAAWTSAKAERHWGGETPKKIYSAGDLRTQLILGLAALLGAGACAFHYFRSLPLTTRFENGRIILPDGRKVDLSKITALSKKHWDKKGVADLAYESGKGKSTRFILDDYKFIGAAQILEEVEKSFAPSQDPPAPKTDESTY
jgi:hypothetical protein